MIVDPYQRRSVARPGEWDLLQSYGDGPAARGPAGVVCPVTAEWLAAQVERDSTAVRFPGARPAELDMLRSYGPAPTAPAGNPVLGAAPPSTTAWPGGATITTVIPAPPTAADQVIRIGWWAASMAATAVCFAHGYKRNRGSVGWGVGWAVFGGAAPFIATPLALVQGFGKEAK